MAAVEAGGPVPDYEVAELYTRGFCVGAFGHCWWQQLGQPDLSLTAEEAAEADAAVAAELGCAAETVAELRAVCRWPRGRRRAGGAAHGAPLRAGVPCRGYAAACRPGPARRCSAQGRAETTGCLQAGICGPSPSEKLSASLGAGAGEAVPGRG